MVRRIWPCPRKPARDGWVPGKPPANAVALFWDAAFLENTGIIDARHRDTSRSVVTHKVPVPASAGRPPPKPLFAGTCSCPQGAALSCPQLCEQRIHDCVTAAPTLIHASHHLGETGDLGVCGLNRHLREAHICFVAHVLKSHRCQQQPGLIRHSWIHNNSPIRICQRIMVPNQP